ncbi:MAG: type II toxin-antitoxin system HicA family toxin [Bryobacter sp.]|jgi:predicted RNA binding protein YcfA (HicA-like mRNA interferase family)|nr:type II toxin-antitoxin system HicA family toxin [Bryobacter sp.]
MPRLLPISGRELCRLLEAQGFEFLGQSGSHRRYRHPDGRHTVVPVHGREQLGSGLLQEILRQVKISKERYIVLRRNT